MASSSSALSMPPVSALNHAGARFNMVECQIRPNRVTDLRVLGAFSEVPREQFVPESLAGVAYADQRLRVGRDRYLAEPLFLARLLQEATVQPEDKALVVGCATGYSAAIMARIAARTTAVECDPELAATAKATLARLGYDSVAVEVGPLEQGWSAGAPYDVVLIDGTIADLPAAIAAQLAEGGRLVTIRSMEGRNGQGMLYAKRGGAVSGRILFDAVAPFLPGFEPRPVFVF